jgi:hypothetical protein
MGVTFQDVKLWNLPIVCRTTDELELRVLDDFNHYIGGLFFDTNKNSDANGRTVLKFDRTKLGKCHIGYEPGQQERNVTYRPGGRAADNPSKEQLEATLLHELGHCVGLAHEQCHEHYAWDYSEKFTSSYMIFKPKNPWNLLLLDAFKREEGKGLFADKMLAIAAERAIRYRDLTSVCDYGSIMMYDIYQSAAAFAKTSFKGNPPCSWFRLIPDTLPGPRNHLSACDVITIKILYKL